MSLQHSIAQTCVSKRSKWLGMPLYVQPHKVAGYAGTEKCSENQNYKVVCKVNSKVETIAYSRNLETATEVAKAVKVMKQLHKEEMKAKLAEQKAKLEKKFSK